MRMYGALDVIAFRSFIRKEPTVPIRRLQEFFETPQMLASQAFSAHQQALPLQLGLMHC